MITFLPYSDFQKSADCLDWQWKSNRLNNQINEGIIIAKTLLGEYEKGWPNHPATLMWNSHELLLIDYTWECLYTWEKKRRMTDVVRRAVLIDLQGKAISLHVPGSLPFWLGDEKFHSIHRSVLLGKNYEWYSQFGWEEEPAARNEKGKWPYLWPVMKEKNEQS